MEMEHAHQTAAEMFGDGYTIERKEFADGDTRTVVVHAVGWGPTCYIQIQAWLEREDVWVEYYEGDVRRSRTVVPLAEFDPDADVLEYVWDASP